LTNNLDNITQSAKLKHAVDHTITLVYKHNKCSCITQREETRSCWRNSCWSSYLHHL